MSELAFKEISSAIDKIRVKMKCINLISTNLLEDLEKINTEMSVIYINLMPYARDNYPILYERFIEQYKKVLDAIYIEKERVGGND